MGYASGRTTEIPRDTERYQEIPFGRRYPNGISLVSLGISAAPPTPEIPRDTKGYQRDTVGIPPPKRYLLYLLVSVSLSISWYLLVSLHISCLVSLTVSSLLSWYISHFSAEHSGNACVIYEELTEISCKIRSSRSFQLTGIKKAVLLKQIQPVLPTWWLFGEAMAQMLL